MSDLRLELYDKQKCYYGAGHGCSTTAGSCRARRHSWLKAKWLHQECVKQSSSCLEAALEGHASLTFDLILITPSEGDTDSQVVIIYIVGTVSGAVLYTNGNTMLLLQTALKT